ncbi:MAG: tetratricopeptide repeat protein [Candidatus Riflebacteria bacterium]|nr:tetratricopeptide repeat protein [Candidatus Riflebacteria bacterium]MBR4570347.1 tetratricopeptide repeat protein [Candidatus Riflebacteria bacterium]
MFKKPFCTILLTAFFIFATSIILRAEINFDFGLPLFRQNEINFEKTKTADYNLQLLKKYILEHKGNVIAQYHAINRWFNLIKLSDTPKHAELIKSGNEYFSIKDPNKASTEEKLRHIFYSGLMLCNNKKEDSECKEEQHFEELLLDYEEELQESADYWIAKGIIFQALKNKDNNYFVLMKPEEDLKIALTLIPRTSQYYYIMGQCFRFLGNTDSALFLSIASYEKASSLDPRNQKLQNSLLSIYMGLHEEYQAKGKHEPFWLEESVYKKIIEIAPANPYALNNLGYLYAEYGVNTGLAVDLCQRAVDQSPDNPGFLDSLGWAAFKNKDFQKAEEALVKSIALKGSIYESRYHLATVYYSNNNYEKAAEQYEEAIKLRPDSAETLNNLAYLYTELNINNEKSLTMAKKANKIEPNNASYLDTLGWAYYRNGDLDNALLYLQKANSLVPAQSEILLHIGRVYLDKNEFEEALIFVKEAFKANPNLNDPDETLYLAIRLKAFHESMANYHGLLGDKADKNKVLNILNGISRLYQEEGLYEKSIEITKICSDLKTGVKTLNEPLLGTYKLHHSEKDKAITPVNPEDKTSEQPKEEKNEKVTPSSIPEEKNKTDENTDPENSLLPSGIDYPVAISFCSDFFKKLVDYFPNLKDLCKCNVTIIMDRLFNAHNSAIIRISSKTLSGKDLKDGIISGYGCIAASKEISKEDKPITYLFPSGKYYFQTTDNAVYISLNPISEETIASLSTLLPYRDDCAMEMYYDNQAFHNRFPKIINGFIKNPFKPFEKLQASYKVNENGINEFIIATTGKEESEEYLRRIAGRLFRFKMKAGKKGLTTNIKMKYEKDLIYISTDFENLFDWATKKVDFLNNKLKNFLIFIKSIKK